MRNKKVKVVLLVFFSCLGLVKVKLAYSMQNTFSKSNSKEKRFSESLCKYEHNFSKYVRSGDSLAWMASKGDIYGVKDAIRNYDVRHLCYFVNQKDKKGKTPLSWAAANGHIEVERVLLENSEIDL